MADMEWLDRIEARVCQYSECEDDLPDARQIMRLIAAVRLAESCLAHYSCKDFWNYSRYDIQGPRGTKDRFHGDSKEHGYEQAARVLGRLRSGVFGEDK